MQPDRDSTGLLWSWGGGDTEGNESERLDTRVYTTDIHDTHITSMDTPHKINKDKIEHVLMYSHFSKIIISYCLNNLHDLGVPFKTILY